MSFDSASYPRPALTRGHGLSPAGDLADPDGSKCGSGKVPSDSRFSAAATSDTWASSPPAIGQPKRGGREPRHHAGSIFLACSAELQAASVTRRKRDVIRG